MKVREIIIYKTSKGRMSIEREGFISITKTDNEEDSLNLRGLGDLISNLDEDDTISILITKSFAKDRKLKNLFDKSYKGFS